MLGWESYFFRTSGPVLAALERGVLAGDLIGHPFPTRSFNSSRTFVRSRPGSPSGPSGPSGAIV